MGASYYFRVLIVEVSVYGTLTIQNKTFATTFMTDNDIRQEWHRHSDDSLSKEQLDDAFDRMMACADAAENSYKGNRSGYARRRFARTTWITVAAAVTLLIVPQITLFVHKSIHKEDSPQAVSGQTFEPVHLCEVYTNNGETREIVLPDNSKVRLNAGSVLIYPEKFSSAERNVYLSGEAVFEVTHSDKSSFTVSTSDIDIKVYGTTFNVNSYPEGDHTSATLCAGSIAAHVKKSGELISLVPSQRLDYLRGSGSASVSRVNASEDTAWTRGDMCFRSANIHEIAKSIERKYGLETYITSGRYDSTLLTAKFVHGETLEKMLDAICKLVPGMTYRIENNCIYIH